VVGEVTKWASELTTLCSEVDGDARLFQERIQEAHSLALSVYTDVFVHLPTIDTRCS
jgi:hypothetical protein